MFSILPCQSARDPDSKPMTAPPEPERRKPAEPREAPPAAIAPSWQQMPFPQWASA